MKKTITILLLCFSTFVSAQNLQFSRVIDTIITVNVGPNYVTIYNNPYAGQSLSPPNGKVWKINNMLISKPAFSGNSPLWTSGGGANSNYHNIIFKVLLENGSNSILINKNDGYYNSIDNNYAASSPEKTVFPLWMNSTTTIQTILESIHIGAFEFKNVKTEVYISLIEFNTQ